MTHPSSIHHEGHKLFVVLGGNGDGECTKWNPGHGSNNHMMGVHFIFAELDFGIHGTVRVTDGSINRCYRVI